MKASGSVVYVDGSLVRVEYAAVSPLDRGFTLGEGVFETMRAENARIFRLAAHLRRLRETLRYLDITLPQSDRELEAALGELLVRNGLRRASVRLTVSRGIPEARGVLPGRMLKGPTVAIQVAPLADYPPERYEAGFRGIVASVRRNETSPASRMKSCNYLDNVFVRLEAAAAGADEGLMLNTAGNVACGSVSNVFALRGGQLLTPPTSAGVLPGITRGVVLEIGTRAGLDIAERDLALQELRESDEAFLTNSLMGVMPLAALDGRAIGSGKPGRVTRLLRERYLAAVAAETS